MKTLLRITAWVAVAAVILWWSGSATFKQRWAPAIEHPLHSVSWARSGFCYPGKCRVG
jgi:hypothetical protein